MNCKHQPFSVYNQITSHKKQLCCLKGLRTSRKIRCCPPQQAWGSRQNVLEITVRAQDTVGLLAEWLCFGTACGRCPRLWHTSWQCDATCVLGQSCWGSLLSSPLAGQAGLAGELLHTQRQAAAKLLGCYARPPWVHPALQSGAGVWLVTADLILKSIFDWPGRRRWQAGNPWWWLRLNLREIFTVDGATWKHCRPRWLNMRPGDGKHRFCLHQSHKNKRFTTIKDSVFYCLARWHELMKISRRKNLNALAEHPPSFDACSRSYTIYCNFRIPDARNCSIDFACTSERWKREIFDLMPGWWCCIFQWKTKFPR